MRPPGVYSPQGDTSLLCEIVGREAPVGGARVLDLGTGTGAVAMAAARGGAARVTAVDVSARAVLAARANALLRGRRMRVLRGDLFGPVAGEVFDVILANPPYVIGGPEPAVRRGGARAWHGGPGGRRILDRLCAQATRHLAPGGTLLLVHSAFSGVEASLAALHRSGLRARVVARRPEPFGPVMRGKAAALEARGLIGHGQRHEELVVIRADRDAAGGQDERRDERRDEERDEGRGEGRDEERDEGRAGEGHAWRRSA
ncbi:release factor glutamine methyltransferase [Actinomadura viridis]|uniref:Release factor glutamine methyltransferase n=1 Tax=Actinomadura viridis TaxID=58110 RepID=A0A931DTZ5_9ACTN|nr:release factor glutamine methyltransferase [Actinomadura viridis]